MRDGSVEVCCAHGVAPRFSGRVTARAGARQCQVVDGEVLLERCLEADGGAVEVESAPHPSTTTSRRRSLGLRRRHTRRQQEPDEAASSRRVDGDARRRSVRGLPFEEGADLVCATSVRLDAGSAVWWWFHPLRCPCLVGLPVCAACGRVVGVLASRYAPEV